jgi:hypothetical protein
MTVASELGAAAAVVREMLSIDVDGELELEESWRILFRQARLGRVGILVFWPELPSGGAGIRRRIGQAFLLGDRSISRSLSLNDTN